MNWFDFRSRLFDLGCFSFPQVYAWQPDFDRNNFVRWTRKGYLLFQRENSKRILNFREFIQTL